MNVNLQETEILPQSSSVYGQDAYASPFNGRMIAQQNESFSDCCPQVWIAGLVQAQQARDSLILETQTLSHSQMRRVREEKHDLLLLKRPH